MSFNESYIFDDIMNATQPTVKIKNHDNSLLFIFVPFAVLITIMLLSAMVYLMARNRRKFYSMYNRHHVPYSFDISELEDDNDDPNKSLLSGKLEIKTRVNNYNTYQTRTNNENLELYT